MDEISLLNEADERARAYTASVDMRRVIPDERALEELKKFAKPFPDYGSLASATLEIHYRCTICSKPLAARHHKRAFIDAAKARSTAVGD